MTQEAKHISLSSSIYALATAYPEIISIMKELGFHDIANPLMLQTMGKIMTIPKGARAKQVSLDHIIQTLENHGFIITKEDSE